MNPSKRGSICYASPDAVREGEIRELPGYMRDCLQRGKSKNEGEIARQGETDRGDLRRAWNRSDFMAKELGIDFCSDSI